MEKLYVSSSFGRAAHTGVSSWPGLGKGRGRPGWPRPLPRSRPDASPSGEQDPLSNGLFAEGWAVHPAFGHWCPGRRQPGGREVQQRGSLCPSLARHLSNFPDSVFSLVNGDNTSPQNRRVLTRHSVSGSVCAHVCVVCVVCVCMCERGCACVWCVGMCGCGRACGVCMCVVGVCVCSSKHSRSASPL